MAPPTPQVDNADNRIVLLADPDSGAIVARVVVPPGGELPEDGFPWVVQAGAAGAAAAQDDDEEEEGSGHSGCSPLLWLVLFACMLGGFAFLASSSEGAGSGRGRACTTPLSCPRPPAPAVGELPCRALSGRLRGGAPT